MKNINVVAAIIKRDDKILATQRGYGDYKDWWEFPGGKVEAGETPQEALVREIREELDCAIRVERHVVDVAWDYPQFHLDMSCWLCSLEDDQLTLVEHEAAKWLDANELDSVKWLPADVEVIDAVRAQSIV